MAQALGAAPTASPPTATPPTGTLPSAVLVPSPSKTPIVSPTPSPVTAPTPSASPLASTPAFTPSAESPSSPPVPSGPSPNSPPAEALSPSNIKNLLTCKQIEGSRVHDPSKNNMVSGTAAGQSGGYSKLGLSHNSMCSFRDVVVVHRADNSSPESSTLGQEIGLRSGKPATRSARSNSYGSSVAYHTPSSSKGMQFWKLSGCYKCHMIVDSNRCPVPRSTICACFQCGEIFLKIESFEHHHQAIHHAVKCLEC
ncbi:hypothetical protein ACFX1X_020615 [Malus domestica]